MLSLSLLGISSGQSSGILVWIYPAFRVPLSISKRHKMYDFMEYCLRCYYRSTGWNEENQYSNLCSWSRALLDFYTPHGLSLYLSKLPTPQFKPSYTMSAFPSLNGSIGYLFTSRPLDIGTSATVDFQDMVDRFRLSTAETTIETKPGLQQLSPKRL